MCLKNNNVRSRLDRSDELLYMQAQHQRSHGSPQEDLRDVERISLYGSSFHIKTY